MYVHSFLPHVLNMVKLCAMAIYEKVENEVMRQQPMQTSKYLTTHGYEGSSYPLPLPERLVNLLEVGQALLGATKLPVDLVWQLFLRPSYGGDAGGAPKIGKPCWELNLGFQTLLSYCGICMHDITVRTNMISEPGIVLAWPCLYGIDVDCESLGLTARRRGLATRGNSGTCMEAVLGNNISKFSSRYGWMHAYGSARVDRRFSIALTRLSIAKHTINMYAKRREYGNAIGYQGMHGHIDGFNDREKLWVIVMYLIISHTEKVPNQGKPRFAAFFFGGALLGLLQVVLEQFDS
eukprot:Gb_37531 [translate_table: standard]